MPDLDIGELERLAKAATPGPWAYRDMRPNTYGPAFVDAADVQSLAICGEAVGRSDTHGFCLQVDSDVRMANAAFIAAANPATILAWAEQHRALIAEREALREKAELYGHMKEVAKANGFDSLTQAIAEAYAARAALTQPRAEEGR